MPAQACVVFLHALSLWRRSVRWPASQPAHNQPHAVLCRGVARLCATPRCPCKLCGVLDGTREAIWQQPLIVPAVQQPAGCRQPSTSFTQGLAPWLAEQQRQPAPKPSSGQHLGHDLLIRHGHEGAAVVEVGLYD